MAETTYTISEEEIRGYDKVKKAKPAPPQTLSQKIKGKIRGEVDRRLKERAELREAKKRAFKSERIKESIRQERAKARAEVQKRYDKQRSFMPKIEHSGAMKPALGSGVKMKFRVR